MSVANSIPLRDDARNEFEGKENALIKEAWESLSTVEQRVAMGNLVIHYRSELVRLHYCTLAAAEELKDKDVSDELRIRGTPDK